MAEGQKIFIAYCYPEKRWLDRVQAVIAPLAGAGNIVVWDERKFRSSNSWRGELAGAISASKVAVMLVSERFVESDFVVSAKLPALLEAARADGLGVCWILVSHCLYETAALDESLAANNLDRPLDGLSPSRRDAELGEVARKIKALAAGELMEALTEAAPKNRKKKATGLDFFESEDLPPSPFIARLADMIVARRESVSELRHLVRWLLMAALGIAVLSVPIAALRGSLTVLLLIAGFGALVASLAVVLQMRTDFLAQSIVGVRYVKTGLGDHTLPTRQRGALLRRAKEILGEA